MTNQNKPIKYDIKQAIGQLSVSGTGWTRELNIIAWNDAAPKLDIRDWSPDHQKMSRGITLTGEEVQNLIQLMAASDVSSLGL